MNKTIRLFAFSISVLASSAITASAQVRVMADEVSDTRRSDGFFNKLEIKLRLLGDALADAKATRVKVARAVDETGKDLISEKTNDDEFKEIGSSSESNPKIELELKNPARRATVVQEISGSIELFAPRRDPASTVTVTNALGGAGKLVVSPALRTHGIEVILWTKEQFEAQKKIEEARMRKEMESKRKEAAEKMGEEMVEGLMKIFGGLFDAMSEMDENSVAVRVDDKQSKLLAVEFESADGKKIPTQSRATMGAQPKTMIFSFEQKLPATAKMKLYLLTPKSVVAFPFKLTGVPLP
ncbi:MAG: hypothetical protein AB7U82_13765 [Blastocatellales bacterium]